MESRNWWQFPMKKPAGRMWSQWPLILILMSGSAPAGELNFGASVVSGDVARFEGGRELSPMELSRGRLQGLTLWLGVHRSAWRGIGTPASTAQHLLQLNLKDAEGKSASIDVIAEAGGGAVMHLIRSDTWSYKSFGGLVKSAAAAQSLPDEELAVLEKILGTT
jgi:hypothetical protein